MKGRNTERAKSKRIKKSERVKRRTGEWVKARNDDDAKPQDLHSIRLHGSSHRTSLSHKGTSTHAEGKTRKCAGVVVLVTTSVIC